MGYAALLERTGNVDEAGKLRDEHSREMGIGGELYDLQTRHDSGRAIRLQGYPAQAEEILLRVPQHVDKLAQSLTS